MNIRSYIAGFLVGGLLLLCPTAEAVGGRGRVVWTKKASHQTGLYTTKNYFVSHGVGVTASAMYYFGDVDNEGVAFNGGFNLKNLSLGGGLNFFYNLPAGNHCNIRFAIMQLMLLFVLSANAQDFQVTKFKENLFDLTAASAAVKDNNGDECALIRFTVQDSNFDFEPNLGVVQMTRKKGEIQLYVPQKTKMVTIRHTVYSVPSTRTRNAASRGIPMSLMSSELPA